jgi:hypothetical protein
MANGRSTTWLVGALLGLALLLPARSGWAQCFECFCNTTGDGVACTSDMNRAAAFCTTANTGCNGFGNISTTACTSLPFQNCVTILGPAPVAAPAPVLSSWQLALMTVLLAGSGWLLLRRRRA